MGVEEFGVDIYILQIIFGGVDIPSKFITILSVSYLGRHITQASTLLLAGGTILSLLVTPKGEWLGGPQGAAVPMPCTILHVASVSLLENLRPSRARTHTIKYKWETENQRSEEKIQLHTQHAKRPE